MKRAISLLLSLIMLFSILSLNGTAALAASTKTYCIAMTPKITDAVYSYLDTVYVQKYPELGKDFLFGSEADKKVLKKLAAYIVKGCKTDKEKAIAISKWAKRNIKYVSYKDSQGTSYFPIDVFYSRRGNCLGYGLFISQMLRLVGVVAVFCSGFRGNMQSVISLKDKLNGTIDGHAWVMVSYNGTWNLFDPLFDVYGNSDKSYISKWYFTDLMEGVSPYYKGMSFKYVNGNMGVFYINGRFMHYVDGMPASRYYGFGASPGTSLNGCVPFFGYSKYLHESGYGGDGFNYVNSSKSKEKMLNDELYSGDWITYGGSLFAHARSNGIVYGCTIDSVGDKTLFMPFCGGPLELQGSSSDYTLTEGYVTYKKGTTFKAPVPVWYQTEVNNGRVIKWGSETPEIATIDKKGNITTHKEGLATLYVCSKDTLNGDTHYLFDFIQIYVSGKSRVAKYNDVCYNYVTKTSNHSSVKTTVVTKATTDSDGKLKKTCKACNKTISASAIPKIASIKLSEKSYAYNGSVKTPKVTVKDRTGKTLVNGIDYTVSYSSGRKYVGKYAAEIRFKGKFSGSKKLYFVIRPKNTSVSSLTAVSKGFKVTWNKQTAQTTGYNIQYSTNSSFSNAKTINITNYKTASHTVTKLLPAKKYYVRIRTYKTVNNTKYYSLWGAAKTVTTKK